MSDQNEDKKETPEADIEVEDEFVPEDGEGNIQDKVASLKEKLKAALAEKQQYLDGWQRTKADFVNARKREEEGRKELMKFANEGLIAELLPVLDSFTLAFANKEAWEKVDKNWRIGVEHIYSQLKGVLELNGLKEFDPKGEEFNPMNHQAIGSVPVDQESDDHRIIDVIQKGYMLNDKNIRPAQVRIGQYTPKNA